MSVGFNSIKPAGVSTWSIFCVTNCNLNELDVLPYEIFLECSTSESQTIRSHRVAVPSNRKPTALQIISTVASSIAPLFFIQGPLNFFFLGGGISSERVQIKRLHTATWPVVVFSLSQDTIVDVFVTRNVL